MLWGGHVYWSKNPETFSLKTKKKWKYKQCVEEFAVCAEQKPDGFASNYYYDNSFKWE